MSSNNFVYSDFRRDFAFHPVTGDLVVKTDVDAIVESVQNIVYTFSGERRDRSIGSNIRTRLFDNPSPITADSLKTNITIAIQNNEPRATILEVYVVYNPDANGYDVRIVFSCVNRERPVAINMLLQRVR